MDSIPNPNRCSLDAARDARKKGEYSEALRHYAYFFEHALDGGSASLYGVRLSYCLNEWTRLGKLYPPALEALYERRKEALRRFEATREIDYTREDFTENGERYDVIVDTVGTAPYARSKGSLSERGRLLVVLGGLGDMLRAPWVAQRGRQRIIAGPASERVEDLHTLAELAEAGAFRPVIDSAYPLERIRDAHRRVDSGRKRGSVVVTVGEAVGS